MGSFVHSQAGLTALEVAQAYEHEEVEAALTQQSQ